jgi:hypothetical protein
MVFIGFGWGIRVLAGFSGIWFMGFNWIGFLEF